MNRSGKIVVCFAAGLVLNASLTVSLGALSSNPYQAIVTRNIFGLNPPQAKAPATVQPPAKITPDGLMTIFGTRQVLFNVIDPPRPGHPAKKKSYILSEGQQQDDIEVKHIDVKGGMVTFNNHGVVQEIPLAKAAPITTPTPVVMRPGARRPAAVAFRGFRPPGHRSAPRLASRPGQNNPGNGVSNVNGNRSGSSYGSAGFGNVGGTPGGQNRQQLSPEEQMIMIAAQHAEAQKRGDPTAILYPRTPLDSAAGVVPHTPQQQGSQ